MIIEFYSKTLSFIKLIDDMLMIVNGTDFRPRWSISWG